jgi:hypothetical protein
VIFVKSTQEMYEEDSQLFTHDLASYVALTDYHAISVLPDDPTKHIGTARLEGCLYVVSLIETMDQIRRIGHGHYASISLLMESYKKDYPCSDRMNELCTLTKGDYDIRKASTLVFSSDPVRDSTLFKMALQNEAKLVLGSSEIRFLPYNNDDFDFCQITIPNHAAGKPSYRTGISEGTIGWEIIKQ